MKYFLSGELNLEWWEYIIANCSPNYYYLCSYFYVRRKPDIFNLIYNNFQNLLIDSGAFTLQRGKKVDFLEYSKQYAKFIKKYDTDKIIGYFEMDIDTIVGYEEVLKLRHILEDVSDKIIPVWHKNRGLDDFKEMCNNYDYVAITNKSTDINSYNLTALKAFVDYAHKHNTKIHGLGISSKRFLEKIPFDSVDSTSFLLPLRFARLNNGKRLDSKFVTNNHKKVLLLSYITERKKQIYYYDKWKNVCKWEE